jgi:hypothetical protein
MKRGLIALRDLKTHPCPFHKLYNFIALPSEDMDEGIDDVLKAIGSISGADRGYIFQLNDNSMVNTHDGMQME